MRGFFSPLGPIQKPSRVSFNIKSCCISGVGRPYYAMPYPPNIFSHFLKTTIDIHLPSQCAGPLQLASGFAEQRCLEPMGCRCISRGPPDLWLRICLRWPHGRSCQFQQSLKLIEPDHHHKSWCSTWRIMEDHPTLYLVIVCYNL